MRCPVEQTMANAVSFFLEFVGQQIVTIPIGNFQHVHQASGIAQKDRLVHQEQREKRDVGFDVPFAALKIELLSYKLMKSAWTKWTIRTARTTGWHFCV